jgi:multimeric flavodoxin WrbA
MKITILDGNMNQAKSDYSIFIDDLVLQLKKHHSVDYYPIDKMELQYCSGCWSCWWKTPGECSQKDGAEQIFRSYINSDFIIFTSPLIAGFTSSALKKIVDRLIVLLHPYIQMKMGESHHNKRYDRYPEFGLILQKEEYTDEEDIKITNDIYDRLALNFHTTRRYTRIIGNTNLKEIVNETCNI